MREHNIQHQIGKCYWFELPAHNVLDAMSFYEGLFGWKYMRLKDSPIPDYWIIEKGGEFIGGLRQSQQTAALRSQGDTPILYFTVEKLDPAVSRAKELGAKVVGDRVELGKQRGVYQWIRDREQNLVALWAPV